MKCGLLPISQDAAGVSVNDVLYWDIYRCHDILVESYSNVLL